ncbi:MAG: TIR domain-containing protein [Ignavibacteriae bacterium]|nr:TIR domain-containing protein [Ignavibacteriota bacterium]NOG99291.1 TIR domain-containing protein [Ignavibacteriota bacterium]
MNIENKFKYEVALSFAGEDRRYVKEVAVCLEQNGISVFFDEFNETELWGKDLYVYLDEIYRKESRFCLMFLSESYAKKLWTNHERESAQSRAFQEHQEYILPIKLDDTEIPGIRPTIGYLDGRKFTPNEICNRVLSKLSSVQSNFSELEDDADIPVVKRIITDDEKNKYLLNAFDELKKAFSSRLEKLSNKNKHVTTELKEISKSEFISIAKTEEFEFGSKLWCSKRFSDGLAIFYRESYREDFQSNSYNDSAHAVDNGIEIYFEILGLVLGSVPGTEEIDLKHASTEDLIKYFWGRFISNFSY